MPRPTRSSRTRRRGGRTSTRPPASAMTAPPEAMAPSEAMIPAMSGRPAPQQRTTPTAAAAARGGPVTDYGYVIGELQRTGVITAAIIVLLLVLWLILR